MQGGDFKYGKKICHIYEDNDFGDMKLKVNA
jgi:hypothetical protein